MKNYRRVIIDIIPCVVVTSLETDANHGCRCRCRQADGEKKPSVRSRKEGTNGAVAILRRKKGPRFVYLKTQIQ